MGDSARYSIWRMLHRQIPARFFRSDTGGANFKKALLGTRYEVGGIKIANRAGCGETTSHRTDRPLLLDRLHRPANGEPLGVVDL